MIAPKCDKCLQELTDFGALAFSPPNAEGQVTKYHLCVGCFDLLNTWLKEHPANATSNISTADPTSRP